MILDGKKTYIFGGLAIISVLLRAFGLIDDETLLKLLGIFMSGEIMSVRSAIKK